MKYDEKRIQNNLWIIVNMNLEIGKAADEVKPDKSLK